MTERSNEQVIAELSGQLQDAQMLLGAKVLELAQKDALISRMDTRIGQLAELLQEHEISTEEKPEQEGGEDEDADDQQ